MELTLKANGFQELSLNEMLVLDGGGWGEAAQAFACTLLIAGGTLALFVPGAQGAGAMALGSGIGIIGDLIR